MKNTLILLFLTTFGLHAQNKGDFTLEFELNKIRYENTESINRYMNDTLSYLAGYLGDRYKNDTIKQAPQLGLSFSYQPLNFMSFGVFGSIQFNRVERTYSAATAMPGDYGGYIIFIANNFHTVNTRAMVAGISTTLYLNKLLNLDKSDKKFLQRFQLAVSLKGGFSFNTLAIDTGTKSLHVQDEMIQVEEIPSSQYKSSQTFRSNSFSGALELKVGYRIIDSKLFSTIGMKVGYQMQASKEMQDRGQYGLVYGIEKEKVKLNFSGLYYGIYLNIGK